MVTCTDPTLNGQLRYPNNLDQSLNDAVADKVRKYRADHNNNPPTDDQTVATVNPDTPNVVHVMMKLEQAKARAKTANKVALEEEKEKDVAEKAVEELKRQTLAKLSQRVSRVS